jgi:siroheme synthase (precorrin-2 oxidase/ferrochelatase)
VGKLHKKINAETLEDIAAWADEIKPTSSHLPDDADTLKFLTDFPKSNDWHFVDLPIDTTAYDTIVYAALQEKMILCIPQQSALIS